MNENGLIQLAIIKTPIGELETNVDELEKFVTGKLTEYNPEKYTGDVESAKKARAELNKSADYVKDGRKQLEEEMKKPYAVVLDKLKVIEKTIKECSGNIDDIVKIKEQQEKDHKKDAIQSYWNTTNFNLFPMDKIFVEKWLNKTCKISDVKNEIDALQKKAYTDLQVIERLPEDVETLKALYLNTLDISSTLQQADQLKNNRERIKREIEERQQRELNEQKQELSHDIHEAEKEKPIENLADSALADDDGNDENNVVSDPVMSYTLKFTAPRSVLFQLRAYMTAHGIKYTKIENEVE